MSRIKLVNGVPTAMTVEEEAARDAEEAAWIASAPTRTAESSRITGFDSAIAGDAIIQSLKSMTAAQFDTWWDANVTNAAQAIGILKRLIKIIIRRLL